MLPQLEASIPPAIKVSIISDRTQTIRASVADVQFTLLLTVALVVMVIFLFLRNFWATVIPAVTVPLSLIGTFAVLYELGYSLDNLSLMALSIAVGFVVDDAVVVIENIVRHIEGRRLAVRGGAQGRGRDRFHHRLDYAFAHRGLHSAVPDERLCRIAVPRIRRHGQRGARAVAADLADADADDVRAPAQAGEQSSMAGSTGCSSAASTACSNVYEAALKIVLRHRFITLMAMLGTIGSPDISMWSSPRGSFRSRTPA